MSNDAAPRSAVYPMLIHIVEPRGREGATIRISIGEPLTVDEKPT